MTFLQFAVSNCLLSSAGKLTTDDLNSLIAHAHRRIDQLNKELVELRVREQQHIETALEKQKLEDKKAFESAVAKALERHKSEIQTEQEKKVSTVLIFQSCNDRSLGVYACSCTHNVFREEHRTLILLSNMSRSPYSFVHCGSGS